MNIINFDEDDEALIKDNISNARKNLHENETGAEIIDLSEDDEDEITPNSIAREILSVVINVVICFVVVFLITHFIGQRTVVSGSSMEDTLSDGDNLIVDRISYRFNDPQRYDVVVFPYQYEENTYYIKRIIGLPGEVVKIDSNGNIYINGEKLEETYGTEKIANAGLASTEIVLATDEYFVLGDNRNNSTDSRFEAVGNIKGSDIIGRAWVRLYPFNEICFVGNLE